MEASDALLQVIGYHQETKHHFFRYARALGYLDWANQPDPFRRYAEAPFLSLPLLKSDEDPRPPTYDDLYHGGATPAPLSVPSLSRFFEYALAISAWKQAGESRWALRSNPSSGNLHPTEGYVVLPDGAGISPGLYHYAPKEHGLERRLDPKTGSVDVLLQPFPRGALLVALTSIHWREAWKYGERAFRYCQHDAGHAIGAVRIAAAALGWKATVLDGVEDPLISALLGLDRDGDYVHAEREHPDCVMAVWPGDQTSSTKIPLFLDEHAVRAFITGAWQGKANRLSREDPVPWEIIDVVAAASWKSTRDQVFVEVNGEETGPSDGVTPDSERAVSAGQIIRQRRSALAFDGRTAISASRFFLMLHRTMPHHERPLAVRPMPWDTIPWDPAVHLCLFVHRVDGLPSGLYTLVRDPGKQPLLQQAMHDHFLWTRVPGCPADLPLFLLEEGDARKLAAQVSCHQDIAGDSVFSLGMVAEFEPQLHAHGPWFYRRMFWETGVIGQVLYLEAEAAGVRATGIGCYFDDPVHQVFGFKDQTFQSLYHFTTGGPVDDPRLTTLPPYGEHAR